MNQYINIPANSVVPFDFNTFGNTSPASITISGFAVTDIEIYKGTSMTQRASDNGYALLDTDGIDLDGITGIQGCSIDFSDNSDAGFYSVGSYFRIVVSAITVDGLTINFTLAHVRIVVAEGIAGVVEAEIHSIDGEISTPTLLNALLVTGYQTLGHGDLATQASVNTIDDFLDTEIAAIKAKTDQLTFTVANQVDVRVVTNTDKTGYTLSTAGAQALIELCFTYDATATYGTADAGSLVKQIAGNSSGSGTVNANIVSVIGVAVTDPSNVSITVSPRLVNGALPLITRTVYTAANENLIQIENASAEWDADADSAVLTIRDNYSGTYILNRLASTTYLPAQFLATFSTTIGNIGAITNATWKLELVYGGVYKPIMTGPASFKDGLQDI